MGESDGLGTSLTQGTGEQSDSMLKDFGNGVIAMRYFGLKATKGTRNPTLTSFEVENEGCATKSNIMRTNLVHVNSQLGESQH